MPKGNFLVSHLWFEVVNSVAAVSAFHVVSVLCTSDSLVQVASYLPNIATNKQAQCCMF